MGKSRSVSRLFGWVSVRLGCKEDTSYGILMVMGIIHPRKLTAGYAKGGLRVKIWPLLVSMLHFWGVVWESLCGGFNCFLFSHMFTTNLTGYCLMAKKG